jgi:hypothetical protein
MQKSENGREWGYSHVIKGQEMGWELTYWMMGVVEGWWLVRRRGSGVGA